MGVAAIAPLRGCVLRAHTSSRLWPFLAAVVAVWACVGIKVMTPRISRLCSSAAAPGCVTGKGHVLHGAELTHRLL